MPLCCPETKPINPIRRIKTIAPQGTVQTLNSIVEFEVTTCQGSIRNVLSGKELLCVNRHPYTPCKCPIKPCHARQKSHTRQVLKDRVSREVPPLLVRIRRELQAKHHPCAYADKSVMDCSSHWLTAGISSKRLAYKISPRHLLRRRCVP